MKDIKEYINESSNINELSNILKNISTDKDFIKLLNDNEYEYSMEDTPKRNELIDGLCDFVDYYIYSKYKNKYIYYNLSNGHYAHWVIYDPEDRLYKDGYDYKGKSNWQDLHWYKQLNNSAQTNIKLEKATPNIIY